MKYENTQARILRRPEVVLNLWAYAGEDGYIMRLAGRFYVLDGEDSEKLSLLRQLATTDFLCATWKKVPSNFAINGPEEEMRGVAHASMLSEPVSHSHLFGPFIEKLAQRVPSQMRSVSGDYRQFTMELPEEPLTVTTVVIEYEDGRLVLMASGKSL